MLKLDPVTGGKTLTNTLTDAACTSQFEAIPKMDINFPYLENVSSVKYYRIIVPTSVYLCRLHM
jgi:hypothetical protein